jgi:hypothetical protein
LRRLKTKPTPMKRVLLSLALLFSLPNLKAADGDSIWEQPIIHDIYFTFSQTGYYDSLVATHTTGNYLQCDMTFDGVLLPSCGLRFKGNSSFNNPSQKKSMKVDLNEFVAGQDYDGIKKFNLNNLFKDPTFIREKLTMDYMNDHGIHSPRCTYARVYYNNVYWGLFTLVEDVNSKFLEQHFGNKNGNLFKGDPHGDLKWFGTSVSSYTPHYELDQTSTNDWTDLVNLINTVNNAPTATYYTSLEDSLFGWDFLANCVINNMFVNLDSYCGSGHNYYIYHDSTLMKWRWLPWDVNETFGSFTLGMNPTQLKTLPFDYVNQSINRPLFVNMMADPTYHQVYVYTYCQLMADFNNAYLDPYIDSIANVIRTDVYADPNKFYSNSDFETNLTSDITGSGPNGGNILGLKDFITARRASLETQLATYGCYVGTGETPMVNESLKVYPNPATDIMWVTTPDSWTGSEFTSEILDYSGRVVMTANHAYGTYSFSADVSDLSTGVYFIVLKNSNGGVLSYRFCKSA